MYILFTFRLHCGFCFRENRSEIAAGIRFFALCDLLGRAARDQSAAAVAALGTEIEDIIRDLDDVKVVLDDDDRVPRVHELLQHIHKPVHIRDVQAGRRLVEDIERAACGAAGELRGELDALGLAVEDVACVKYLCGGSRS